jgi:hypothetical protein
MRAYHRYGMAPLALQIGGVIGLLAALPFYLY